MALKEKERKDREDREALERAERMRLEAERKAVESKIRSIDV